VAPETERRIRRIIQELDYKPNVFAQQLKISRNYAFGVLMPKPSQDSEYWAIPLRGIRRAERELAAQRVEVKYFFFDKFSQKSFDTVSRDVENAHLDGLVLAPVLAGTMDDFLGSISGNLEYVCFDSFIPGHAYLSYIGQDSFQSGVLSGRLMHLLLPKPGSIAILKPLPEDYHINDRVIGFLSYFKKRPEYTTYIYEIKGDAPISEQNSAFQGVISDLPQLSGVFVSNASTHMIARFLKARGGAERIRIIGYDLNALNIRYLKDGVIDFLISQQSERQGYESLLTLFRHVVLKEGVEKKLLMQLDIVTSENIDYYQS
jgi:LacI family transcriptional regulator